MEEIMYYEDIPNQKTVNGKTCFNCTTCGDCCHIREKKNISVEEEKTYFAYMFKNFGVMYLAKLDDITISIMPSEAEALKNEADKRGIVLDIKPKRAVYDKQNDQLILLDYFMDHDICPFYDEKTRKCTVYDIRPMICKTYPLLGGNAIGKCKYKLENIENYHEEKIEVEKMNRIISTQKNMLKKMLAEGKIVNTVTEEEFQEIIKKSKIVELRLN